MMKAVLAALLAGSGTVALAQSGHDPHQHRMEPSAKQQAKQQAHKAAGVVKSVNAEKGTVTIDHEPVESLKWPRMTMGFKAQDRKLLAGLKPGQKVSFEFVQRGKDYVIVSLR
jgi:Cu/Ag efflux protein CusF